MTQQDKEVLIRFMGCDIVKTNSRYSTDAEYSGSMYCPEVKSKKAYYKGSTPKKITRQTCNESCYHNDWNWLIPLYQKVVNELLNTPSINREEIYIKQLERISNCVTTGVINDDKEYMLNHIISVINWLNKLKEIKDDNIG